MSQARTRRKITPGLRGQAFDGILTASHMALIREVTMMVTMMRRIAATI